MERLSQEVSYALSGRKKRASAHIFIQTFGEFDVLIDGETKMGYGGGSCQVSSTLYNTVLQLQGITILERHAHGASGAAYLPHGMDASSGALNFRMANDFGFPIRIEGSCHDLALTILIYRADGTAAASQ